MCQSKRYVTRIHGVSGAVGGAPVSRSGVWERERSLDTDARGHIRLHTEPHRLAGASGDSPTERPPLPKSTGTFMYLGVAFGVLYRELSCFFRDTFVRA
ncbi:hypothetical protein MHYP_G00056400 [Metynnis hypsauchen]